ncbi:undecaprenyl-diphosphate phosphatase [bacterium]|nr:undecaprenyl-diphosphate phosphatase [bacterium]
MGYVESFSEGAIQGLTEFLPISSSGHLHLFHGVVGDSNLPIFFAILLHIFSLLAVLIVFRKDIWRVIIGFFKMIFEKKINPDGQLALFIIVATIPTAIIGLLLEDYFEKLFSNPIVISGTLFVNGVILFASKYFQQKDGVLTYKKSLIIGIIQGVAIIPGISRSGSTISAAIFLGVDRGVAGVFSFLLSIPAILGAGLLHAKDLTTLDSSVVSVSLVGGLASFVFGLFSLVFLLKLIKKGKFYYFAYYCWLISILSFVYYAFIK